MDPKTWLGVSKIMDRDQVVRLIIRLMLPTCNRGHGMQKAPQVNEYYHLIGLFLIERFHVHFCGPSAQLCGLYDRESLLLIRLKPSHIKTPDVSLGYIYKN